MNLGIYVTEVAAYRARWYQGKCSDSEGGTHWLNSVAELRGSGCLSALLMAVLLPEVLRDGVRLCRTSVITGDLSEVETRVLVT